MKFQGFKALQDRKRGEKERRGSGDIAGNHTYGLGPGLKEEERLLEVDFGGLEIGHGRWGFTEIFLIRQICSV